MDWVNYLFLPSFALLGVLIGFVWATRFWYPKIRKLNRELDAERTFRRNVENKRYEAETNYAQAKSMREFHEKEALLYFNRSVKLQAHIVELEKLLHGTEEALRFHEQQAVIESARKTNAAQSENA